MDNPTPSLREQGIQALRAGNIDPAVDLLARAVIADPQDAEAQAFLGVAYSQKGMYAQAKRALDSAIELQPGNAGFRFNLGVALEQAGDGAGAASAYREALQINPEHPQARARAQALAGQAPTATPAARQPAAPPSTASPSDAPWLRGRAVSPAAPAGPPGTVQCPHCQEWSKPGLSCEWCSGPLQRGSSPMSGVALDSAVSPSGYAPRRPFRVSLLVVLYDLAAICSIIIGIGFGISAAGAAARPDGMPKAVIMAAVAAATMVMALVMLTVAYFLWRGFNWARVTLIILLVLALLGQLAQILSSRSPVVPLLEVTLSVLFLAILNTRRTREFCTR
jgi:hypothetical protein